MKKKVSIRLKYLFVVLVCGSLWACTDESPENTMSHQQIGFIPTADTEWSKGPVSRGLPDSVTTISLEGGEQPLYLHVVSQPREDVVSDSRGITTVVDGSNSKTLGGSIGVSAHGAGIGYYMLDEKVSADKNWMSDYYWPNQALHFMAYAPYDASVIVTPKPDAREVFYKFQVKDDVKDQIDLMVAFILDSSGPGAVPLNFRHICTEIKFLLESIPQGNNVQTITIEGIKDEGIYVNGEAQVDWGEYTSGYPENSTEQNLYPTGIATYTMEFDQTPQPGQVISTYNKGDATLYMIPQTLENAKLSIVLKDTNGTETTYTANLNGVWSRNHSVTYKISINQ